MMFLCLHWKITIHLIDMTEAKTDDSRNLLLKSAWRSTTTPMLRTHLEAVNITSRVHVIPPSTSAAAAYRNTGRYAFYCFHAHTV